MYIIIYAFSSYNALGCGVKECADAYCLKSLRDSVFRKMSPSLRLFSHPMIHIIVQLLHFELHSLEGAYIMYLGASYSIMCNVITSKVRKGMYADK